ncbi:MAG: protein kinase, partial [Acidobacteriota bacterium]
TAAYMSPEQAKGRAVDKRADIWAFGVVLFEMLTGKRLYTAETASETLAAVIKDEPDWNALPTDTPAALRKLLRRCLQKNPKLRIHDIADARIEIEEGLAEPAGEVGLPVGIPSPQPLWRRVLPWAMVGMLAVALAVSLWPEPEPSPEPLRQFSVEVAPTELLNLALGGSVVLSPDGTRLAYVAGSGENQKLYLRPLDQLQASALSGTEGAFLPFFSPDGQWLAFFAGGKLKKVSVSGGAVVTLCDATFGRGGSWSPDDTIIFTPNNSVGLSRVAATGGTPEPISRLDEEKNESTHLWPQILPSEKAVLFTSRVGTTSFDEASIEVLMLETGERKVLHRGGSYGRYLPSGHLVFIHEGTLFAAPLDLQRMELTGPPAPILEGVAGGFGGSSLFAFSQEGTLVYLPGTTTQFLPGTKVVWVDREGNTQPLLDSPKVYIDVRLSPDDRRLATRIGSGGSQDLWVLEFERGTLSRLTFDAAAVPVWTPDGERVTFTSSRSGDIDNIYWKRADGTGEVELLTESQNRQHPFSWSPDGKVLVFGELDPNNDWDLWTLRLEGEKKPELFLGTPFYESFPSFSPDGRWLAYQSDESGRYEIYVRPYPGPGSKWQISTDGGSEPVWARKGRELFYQQGDKMMVVSYSAEGDAFRAGTPRLLFEGEFAQWGPYNLPYDVTADGKRFVMLQRVGASEGEADRTHLTFILNWFDEVRRRVASAGQN